MRTESRSVRWMKQVLVVVPIIRFALSIDVHRAVGLGLRVITMVSRVEIMDYLQIDEAYI